MHYYSAIFLNCGNQCCHVFLVDTGSMYTGIDILHRLPFPIKIVYVKYIEIGQRSFPCYSFCDRFSKWISSLKVSIYVYEFEIFFLMSFMEKRKIDFVGSFNMTHFIHFTGLNYTHTSLIIFHEIQFHRTTFHKFSFAQYREAMPCNTRACGNEFCLRRRKRYSGLFVSNGRYYKASIFRFEFHTNTCGGFP